MADYIDREALLRKLEHDAESNYGYLDRADIEEFPAADVAPVRHGHWLTVGHLPWCSRCGSVVIIESHFCPNCGARMDGGEGHEAD